MKGIVIFLLVGSVLGSRRFYFLMDFQDLNIIFFVIHSAFSPCFQI